MEVMKATDPVAAERAAQVLRAGGVILYPTDTLYGLGADALSDEAVDKIYTIKGREKGKPIHAIVSDMEMAGRYAQVNELARRLGKDVLPGPLTLILKKRETINTGIARDIDTIGIRIPDNDFCLKLAKEFDAPFTATSANKSGAPPGRRFADILTQLGNSADDIDLVIDAGELPESLPSTVVDATSGKAVILREGAIPAQRFTRP